MVEAEHGFPTAGQYSTAGLPVAVQSRALDGGRGGGAKPWGKTEGDLPADLTQMVQYWPSLHKTQHQIFI